MIVYDNAATSTRGKKINLAFFDYWLEKKVFKDGIEIYVMDIILNSDFHRRIVILIKQYKTLRSVSRITGVPAGTLSDNLKKARLVLKVFQDLDLLK